MIHSDNEKHSEVKGKIAKSLQMLGEFVHKKNNIEVPRSEAWRFTFIGSFPHGKS
jgi:hypothetical protein